MKKAGRILRLLRLERTVASLLTAVEFYCGALGFSVIEQEERTCKLKLGAQQIWLTEYDPPGSPYPENSTSCDLWFQHAALVTTNMFESFHRLKRHGYTPISLHGPQRLPAAAGGVTAYKFRDPDGHPLELIHFPPGAGDARFQSAESLTIGIDHSAISVTNAERSIEFYRDILGMNIAARQTNSGIEQERLDSLPGAVVEVIALAPALQSTPHLELLAYNTPRPGQVVKAWNSSDIVGDRLVFEVDDLAAILARQNTRADDPQCATIRDPDGHLLTLVQTS